MTDLRLTGAWALSSFTLRWVQICRCSMFQVLHSGHSRYYNKNFLSRPKSISLTIMTHISPQTADKVSYDSFYYTFCIISTVHVYKCETLLRPGKASFKISDIISVSWGTQGARFILNHSYLFTFLPRTLEHHLCMWHLSESVNPAKGTTVEAEWLFVTDNPVAPKTAWTPPQGFLFLL